MEIFRSEFKKKLIFTDLNIKIIADIVYTILKCLNFIIFERKLKKKRCRLRVIVFKSRKKQKNAFFRRRVK